MAWCGPGLAGQPSPKPDLSLPVLTSAEAVHNLTVAESKRHYPVRLRTTVLVYLPKWHASFTHDGRSGIYVDVLGQPVLPIHPGSVLDIDGVSGPGDFAPVIEQRSVRIVGAVAGRQTKPWLRHQNSKWRQ
jgi:hypothetical protein